MIDSSIERIAEVVPHPDADRLDLVTVLGFQCVTEKGLYNEGDIIAYIRPDAVLPQTDWAEGYRKYSPKRIKAVRLRKEWSEGIIVPLDLVKEELGSVYNDAEKLVGTEVSELLEVTHYEPPIPQDMSAKGGLPYGIPKTDEERWENLVGKRNKLPFGELVDLTLKLDGQSLTVYYHLEDDAFGVTGRSLEFKSETTNNYTANVEKFEIYKKLKAYCIKYKVSIALRGESYGSGIQGSEINPHAKEPLGLAIFSVYNIDTRSYERKGSLHYFLNACHEMGLPTVPILEEDVELTQEKIDHYSKDIKKIQVDVDKKAVPFEGVVAQHEYGSFKIINKNYDSQK